MYYTEDSGIHTLIRRGGVAMNRTEETRREDTITAIATAWGEAGIAVVRLSGPEALAIADGVLALAEPLSETPPRHMRNGYLLDEKRNPIDQILAVWFAAPKSYTGENVVEIHTHGGSLVASRCLDLLVCGGARHAEPGEFTKRAFLSGRIDLPQAEAVLGIIRSRSDEALRAAARTLQGELGAFASSIYDELMTLSGHVEVALDFPEEETQDDGDTLALSLQAIVQSLEDLLDRCSTGFLLREGVRVAIVGRPNVGKSSLLNALLKESRAIVTSVPGTTRDLIEEVLTYRGIPLRLVDTAGIGTPADEVEALGMALTEEAFRKADVRIWVVDGSLPLDDRDRALADRLSGLPHVVAVNKSDLTKGRCDDGRTTDEAIADLLPVSAVLSISAKQGVGVDPLKDAIVSAVSGGGPLEAGLNASARQVEEIRTAIAALKEASQALDSGAGEDAAAACIAEARLAMERLLGKGADDTLLDHIFSQFCVGK